MPGAAVPHTSVFHTNGKSDCIPSAAARNAAARRDATCLNNARRSA